MVSAGPDLQGATKEVTLTLRGTICLANTHVYPVSTISMGNKELPHITTM